MGRVISTFLQDPGTAPASSPWIIAVQDLGWFDTTMLAVILVFFVLGLFKGLIWQVSRVAILVAAYLLAGSFGSDVAQMLSSWMGPANASEGQQETTLYLAYVLIFLVVLVVLSLLALLLQKLVKKAGMTFFDRLGGGVVGIATGAAVVLFLLGFVGMFFGNSALAMEAAKSRSYSISSKAVDMLGGLVPDEMRKLFDLPPLAPATGRGPEPR
ncbi:MAG: hypothetical protein Fur0037_29510 [Planctomycetota bacterium]